MRLHSVALSLPFCMALAVPCFASSSAIVTDEAALAQLEHRAQQANPREQCFLYTELVQEMTVVAGRQLLNGESDRATATLLRIDHYAALIHMDLARDARRLKQAQILMHGASRHLGEYLHLLSPQDKLLVQGTLKQLDRVNDELLTQVFAQ
jgi:hypothetical protein